LKSSAGSSRSRCFKQVCQFVWGIPEFIILKCSHFSRGAMPTALNG
jgi:hypothetical protein